MAWEHMVLSRSSIGRAYRSLCQLIRYYAGDELDGTVRLTLKSAEVPSAASEPPRVSAGAPGCARSRSARMIRRCGCE
jgi:predicted component of type VI protein secretion system